ncbi:PQQ-dependent sugar dehydrogenase [Streptomyces sp. NPDC053493]|uniref:PQQ-dependent sugar dehydrogenase n=1 Tax=Streptomyces sp. NPDC053493 TaxID=3365705 RepID=UPI0037D8C5F4
MGRARVVRGGVAGAAAVLLLVAGCSSPSDGAGGRAATSPGSSAPPVSSPPVSSPAASTPPAAARVRVAGTLTEGLRSPWGVAELPGGDLLVSSRDERTVTRVDAGTGHRTSLGEVPGVVPGGEGGLMGLAVRGDRVYAYLTSASDNRIVRMRYGGGAGDRLGPPEPVLTGIPKGLVHNGGRIAFGPDGMLYAGTGETGRSRLAQDKGSLGGKILRMTPEGRPAPGNPFPGSVVWSYGHRNVQGLAWDDAGRLWASEFGQDTWDELNRIQPGRNYGWPTVEGRAGRTGFTDPVAQWPTAEASPSGIAYARGAIWMAGLRGERLWRIPLSGAERSGEPQALLKGEFGRLRTVLATAGGTRLWLVTSETDTRGTPGPGDDRILRLEITP